MCPCGTLPVALRTACHSRATHLDASCRHDLLHPFSLCTLDKRLSRQRVCSTPLCTHVLSGRASEANLLWRSLRSVGLAQRCCNRPLCCSSVIQCRLEEVHRFDCLSPPFPVPHHANPEGSFLVGRWRTREYCHGFPRKVCPPAHSHPLRKGRWFPALKDNMAIKTVGRVRMMRPTYLKRPRIVMQSYDGTFSVRRSLKACSSFSKRGAPAILRNARLYTDATIRRALHDGGAMSIEKELRDSTRDLYKDQTVCW